MIYGYGARVDNDSNAITVIDEENRTAETKGYINGEYVEFSGGSDLSTAQVTLVNTIPDSVSITLYGAIGDYSDDFGLSPNTLPNCAGTKYAEQSTNTTEVYNLALYEEHGMLIMSSSYHATVMGSIELLITGEEYVIYDITGDCSITLS